MAKADRVEVPVNLHRQRSLYTCLASSFKTINDYFGVDDSRIFKNYWRKRRALDPRLVRLSYEEMEWRYLKKGKDLEEYALTDWLGGIPTSDTIVEKAAVRALDLYDVTLASTNPLFGKPMADVMGACARDDGTGKWGYTRYEMFQLHEFLKKGGKVMQVKADSGWLEDLIREEAIPIIAVSKSLVGAELDGKSISGLHAYIVHGFDNGSQTDQPAKEKKKEYENSERALLGNAGASSGNGNVNGKQEPPKGKVLVADPMSGKLEVDRELFELVWGDSENGMHGAYTIVLRKKKEKA